MFQLQAFAPHTLRWMNIEAPFNGTVSEARDIYREWMRFSTNDIRLILASSPEGQNVIFGSASNNPIQARLDAESSFNARYL